MREATCVVDPRARLAACGFARAIDHATKKVIRVSVIASSEAKNEAAFASGTNQRSGSSSPTSINRKGHRASRVLSAASSRPAPKDDGALTHTFGTSRNIRSLTSNSGANICSSHQCIESLLATGVHEVRISDDRYNRDIRRHTLAMRLIRHQARTDTIQRWTGLSAFRIRALVHTYTGERAVQRHRGAAPRKLSVFYKSTDHEIQGLALAICYQLEGLIPKQPVLDAARAFPGLEAGERLCNAFEAFIQMFPKPYFALEHAMLLAIALASAEEFALGECSHCGGLVITKSPDRRNALCVFCRIDIRATAEGGPTS